MDLLANVPSWDDIERNLDDKFNTLNQGYSDGLQSAHDSWNGFTRRVSTTATQAYGYMGGNRIDSVKAAMRLSQPIIESNLKRKWASIEIEQILPILLQLVKEVAMILGGSVAVGTIAGGVAGSFFFGVGAVPVAAVGAGIGLQVGNLILLTLGLASIAEYFYQGLPACLATLQEGFATAWHADEGLKPEGLDPTGGSAYVMQERIDRAAQQLAKGQEQLVLLLFTAIVTYWTRGQVKAGLMGSMDSIAARSTKLQAEISNKQFANWLARNEQKLLAQPELRAAGPIPLEKTFPDPPSVNKSLPEDQIYPDPVKIEQSQENSARPDTYAGVKEASSFLKSKGVPRAFRKQILESFEIPTINVRQATDNEYGLRYFDGVNAQKEGRYLFETFPANRESLALRTEWNQMTYFAQFKVAPGTTIIEGRASAQGVGLSGGQIQKYILNLSDLLQP